MKIIKKVFIKVKDNLLGFIIGVILAGSISVALASGLLSSAVTYDNTNSGLSSTTVQAALDEINEKANNSSGGLYVYAFNEATRENNDTVYYTGASQSTLNSLGTVYGTMSALCAATGHTVGLKYKIENNMVTEAYVCEYANEEEKCIRGYTDGTYYESNKTLMLNNTDLACSDGSGGSIICGGITTGNDMSASDSGIVDIYESSLNTTCYVSESGAAVCIVW